VNLSGSAPNASALVLNCTDDDVLVPSNFSCLPLALLPPPSPPPDLSCSVPDPVQGWAGGFGNAHVHPRGGCVLPGDTPVGNGSAVGNGTDRRLGLGETCTARCADGYAPENAAVIGGVRLTCTEQGLSNYHMTSPPVIRCANITCTVRHPQHATPPRPKCPVLTRAARCVMIRHRRAGRFGAGSGHVSRACAPTARTGPSPQLPFPA
jgi:hypothetical protein